MGRVLVVGLHATVSRETAQQLANDLKAKTGIDTVVVDGCSAVLEVDVPDD